MQIPIINGIFTDDSPSVRTSYPVNLIPVITRSGVSEGYLRPADGIVEFATGPGVDRGGINWNGLMYRVMGTKLVSITSAGVVTTLGDVGGSGPVSMDYSFDRLGVASNDTLYYWDGATLTEVTDVDAGDVKDMIWIDGYFMVTDGEYIAVSEIATPTSFLATKYTSAEVDPDPLKGLIKIRNEPHAVGRYTIEVFRNIGGTGFPFQRISGGHITKGSVGLKAFAEYKESLVFVGGGRNEQVAVHIGINGRSEKISTREVDELLSELSESQLEDLVVEYRNDRSSDFLYIHLPDRTLVYDPMASQSLGMPVWCVLTSEVSGFSKYRARHMVYCYGYWLSGDPTSSKVGYFTDSVGSHYGDTVRWEFGTSILYNNSRGATMGELELVALTGSVDVSANPTISTSYSNDGQNWSQDRTISAGTIGDRLKRLIWRRQGRLDSIRMQRFRGDSATHVSFLRLEAQMEPLYS